MSSTKDDRKAQAREERAIDRAIEETKDNASKIIREVRREVPENTATFHDYQEQHLRAVRDMTNEYLDSQKEIAKSLQAAYRPAASNGFAAMMTWPLVALNPQLWTENHVRAATNMADLTVAAVRLENELTAVAMDSTRVFTETARKNTRELGQLGVENAKIVEQFSRNMYGHSGSA